MRKNAQINKELESLNETSTAGGGEQKENTGESETRVGKKLMEMTTRRVITIVLVMLLATPFLTADARELLSMEVGMSDISISGPPSKCAGSPSDTQKRYGCTVMPIARDGVDAAVDDQKRLLL